MFVLAFFAVLCIIWLVGLRRAARLFTLEIRAGRIETVRGNVPARLLAELGDVVGRARLEHARWVVVPRDGRPTLKSSVPLGAGLEQQLRNVLGQFTVAQIRSAPPR